jgi:hypothetical protein
MKTGRTGPLLLGCVPVDDPAVDPIEVVVKFSAGCDQGVVNLAREVVAACLARDLGLPVPIPYLVELPPEFVETISDQEIKPRVAISIPLAFGSRLVIPQYNAWVEANRIRASMIPTAAAIFVFDALTQNADRRVSNPNCLVKGDELRIFDHELAFAHGLLLGWLPPWVAGGLNSLETPGAHIFRDGLRGKPIDYEQIKRQWAGLSEERLTAYRESVPAEWPGAGAVVDQALDLVRAARNNIDGCLDEVRRVLR